jgi:1,4-alpha-glucan branching enzyme
MDRDRRCQWQRVRVDPQGQRRPRAVPRGGEFFANVYYNYRVRVPFAGKWHEVLNSDSAHYGGSNVGNIGEVQTLDGLVPELNLTVPPLAAVFLVPES